MAASDTVQRRLRPRMQSAQTCATVEQASKSKVAGGGAPTRLHHDRGLRHAIAWHRGEERVRLAVHHRGEHGGRVDQGTLHTRSRWCKYLVQLDYR
jgi:hypothetical protein